MNPVIVLLLMLKGSLFSFSGFGNVPIVHDDFVRRGWATERQFAESLAIGQISPGPNGLWLISLGYLMDGFRGAGAALVAITLPPLIVAPIDRVYRRVADHAAVEGFVRGLSLATVGVFVVVMVTIFRATPMDGRTTMIAAAAFCLAGIRRFPLIGVIALGAAAGVVLLRGLAP